MGSEWPALSLREAGVELIDCDHRTPPAAETGYPYVAIPQLRGGRIDVSDARRITPEDFVEWTRKAKPAAYDVALSRRCNPGETAFVQPGLEFALGQNLVLLRADGSKVYPPFLRWLVRGPEWWDQVAKFLNVGAVFDSLKCADVLKFTLRIPPLAEQRAIAHILGTLDDELQAWGGEATGMRRILDHLINRLVSGAWTVDEGREWLASVRPLVESIDHKIELNRRMSETLERMAQALFKSWFVNFDPVVVNALRAGNPIPEKFAKRAAHFRENPDALGLPDHILPLFPARFVDSELGEIPEGWEVGKLGDVLTQVIDRCTPSEETRSRPYVPIECIAARSLLLTESKPGEEAQSSLTRFREGDLLFGAMRPYFHKVAIAPFDGTTRTTVFVLRPHDAQGFGYAAMALHNPKTIEYATNHSTGSTIPYAVWQGSLDAMPIVLPPRLVRTSFDRLVRPLLDRIPPLFFENHTLAALRDALLPKLISGTLRVKVAEKFVQRYISQ